MDCFCGMVDWRKAFSLISSRDHRQRSSPLRIFDTSKAGFEPAQNLSLGLVEWSCAVAITTTPRWTTITIPMVIFLSVLLVLFTHCTKLCLFYVKNFPGQVIYHSYCSPADLVRMYKLLKPLPQAFQAMLVEFQRYITDTGLDQVKSLHTENVSFDLIFHRVLFYWKTM